MPAPPASMIPFMEKIVDFLIVDGGLLMVDAGLLMLDWGLARLDCASSTEIFCEATELLGDAFARLAALLDNFSCNKAKCFGNSVHTSHFRTGSFSNVEKTSKFSLAGPGHRLSKLRF